MRADAAESEDRLFMYGTLAPGRPNEHVLADLPGSWTPESARGRLRPEGWGADAGCPGIELDDRADSVDGLLFSSPGLRSRWDALDEFEDDGYERVATVVHTAARPVMAFVYAPRADAATPR